MQKKQGFGALIDGRSVEEKLKDFKFEELVSAPNPVNWVEKSVEQCRQFPIFAQNGSGSCVAQTEAKLMGIMYYLKYGTYRHFSASHIYQRRVGRPNAGMAGADVHKIAQQGVTFEEYMPSQLLTDEQMDSAIMLEGGDKPENQFKIGNYLEITKVGNIDTIASIIQTTKKGVMVWFYFDWNATEWKDVPIIKFPTIPLYGRDTARHSVTATDFFLMNGKKCLLIEDSWGVLFGRGGRRIITEDFFKARNFYASYPMNFKLEEKPASMTKPVYTFTKPLVFSPVPNYGNPDIIALQNVLKYEGLFPLDTDSTGWYGAITVKAVALFQKKYAVASPEALAKNGGRSVLTLTLKKLNELYSK